MTHFLREAELSFDWVGTLGAVVVIRIAEPAMMHDVVRGPSLGGFLASEDKADSGPGCGDTVWSWR